MKRALKLFVVFVVFIAWTVVRRPYRLWFTAIGVRFRARFVNPAIRRRAERLLREAIDLSMIGRSRNARTGSAESADI
jgi:hypothetical protein